MVSANHRKTGKNRKTLCNHNKNTKTINDLEYFISYN